jgi:hypothetical protein
MDLLIIVKFTNKLDIECGDDINVSERNISIGGIALWRKELALNQVRRLFKKRTMGKRTENPPESLTCPVMPQLGQ